MPVDLSVPTIELLAFECVSHSHLRYLGQQDSSLPRVGVRKSPAVHAYYTGSTHPSSSRGGLFALLGIDES